MSNPTEPLMANGGLLNLFKQLFNLKADTDREGTIENIRSNVDFRSANAWTLVFAIFIASIGLNVNSPAVIIGAMLISPLMGPIVGTGLALGTYDQELLKRSARNLLAAVAISIGTSTIYFLISPLSEVQSELLARTRPSFYDVLIAFFGGAAGIVALSRKERGNAIPGVAIATALMPPLCTAGFGLATRNFSYFVGAIYLFIINGVFISISTFIFVRYLGFHHGVAESLHKNKRVDRWIASIAVIVIIPSFFMAWYLQRESFFKSQANKFIDRELRSPRTYIIERDISYSIKEPKVRVAVLGEHMNESTIEDLKGKARLYSLTPESIEIQQTSLAEHFEKRLDAEVSTAEELSRSLQLKLNQKELELSSLLGLLGLSRQITEEISVIFPKIQQVLVTRRPPTLSPPPDSSSTIPPEVESMTPANELQALIQWKNRPSKTETTKASQFLEKRLGTTQGQIVNVQEL